MHLSILPLSILVSPLLSLAQVITDPRPPPGSGPNLPQKPHDPNHRIANPPHNHFNIQDVKPISSHNVVNKHIHALARRDPDPDPKSWRKPPSVKSNDTPHKNAVAAGINVSSYQNGPIRSRAIAVEYIHALARRDAEAEAAFELQARHHEHEHKHTHEQECNYNHDHADGEDGSSGEDGEDVDIDLSFDWTSIIGTRAANPGSGSAKGYPEGGGTMVPHVPKGVVERGNLWEGYV